MQYISLAEAARIRGGGLSTWRKRCKDGEVPGAIQVSNKGNWLIPRPYIYGYGRTEEEELSPPMPITTDDSGRTIVTAKNDEQWYGVYLDEEWYTAGEALMILEYLQEHKAWLKEQDALNIQKRLDYPNPLISNLPVEQRPPQKAWKVIQELISRGEARLTYEPGEPYVAGVYRVLFTEGDSIALNNVGYHKELGLYDKTLTHLPLLHED